MLGGAYKNAVACLNDKRRSAGSSLDGLSNPLVDSAARFTVDHGVPEIAVEIVSEGRAISSTSTSSAPNLARAVSGKL